MNPPRRARAHAQLDYAAGVLPVGRVDRTRDAYPPNWRDVEAYGYARMNDVARAAHAVYEAHADAMHGLPLAVQVVGGRFGEERVLGAMRVVEGALREAGMGYVPEPL